MERTKKEEKLIITYFGLFLILILLSIIIALLFVNPKINEIEKLKTQTANIYADYKRVESAGMSYDEFTSSLSDINLEAYEGEDDYIPEVINSITPEFYEENLVNNTGEPYSNFLTQQVEELSSWSPIEKKNELIAKILPVYSELINDLGEGTLTDFKFINYVESVIETFSLDFSNTIGISEINLVDNYSIGILDNSLETNIYYIPLTLNISGRRTDILDFLYYASKVGEIKIEDEELLLNTDLSSDFRSSFRNRLLKGQVSGDNIFSNQIFDIESITFDGYIDPSTDISEKYMSSSLVSYIKSSTFPSTQDNLKAEAKLRFYIKGLPLYKIEKYIKDFLNDFNRINNEVIENISNTSLTTVDRQTMMDINNTMQQLEESIIPQIQREMMSNETINEAFENVNSYYPVLNDYQYTLDQLNK